MAFRKDWWAVDEVIAQMICLWGPNQMVYLSVKGVRPLSKERPWWGGGLLPGTTQSRPAPLYAGRWLTILYHNNLLAGATAH